MAEGTLTFLESLYGSNFNFDIVTNPTAFSIKVLKMEILALDFSTLLADSASISHLGHIMAVEQSSDISSLRIWNLALDHGSLGTSSALAMLKLLGLKSFSGKWPVIFSGQEIDDELAGAHFLVFTLIWKSGWEIVSCLKNCSKDFVELGSALQTCSCVPICDLFLCLFHSLLKNCFHLTFIF